MTNSPLISLIVPVYNVKDFLKECLNSVLNQTYQNLEIIIINDGSTDGSEQICKDYAKRDSRIILKHQKNSGLSAARNSGLKLAKGKYIAFVDSDDYIEPNLVERSLATVQKTGADIVVFGYNNQLPSAQTLSGEAATIRLLTKQENLDILAWNKLYSADLFKKHHVEFPVGDIHEDNLTTYKLLSLAKTVAYLPESLYTYRERSGSITAKNDIRHRLDVRERAVEESRIFLDAKNHPVYQDAVDISLLLAKFARLDASLRSELSNNDAQKTLIWLREHHQDFINNRFLTKKLATYLELSTKLGGVPYKTFRKIKHE